MHDAQELYAATRMLLSAFHYLQPRMRGGSLSPPQPMNAEGLAGCILHQCMSRVVRDLQTRATRAAQGASELGWSWSRQGVRD